MSNEPCSTSVDPHRRAGADSQRSDVMKQLINWVDRVVGTDARMDSPALRRGR
jgi:hypothetical protein